MTIYFVAIAKKDTKGFRIKASYSEESLESKQHWEQLTISVLGLAVSSSNSLLYRRWSDPAFWFTIMLDLASSYLTSKSTYVYVLCVLLLERMQIVYGGDMGVRNTLLSQYASL